MKPLKFLLLAMFLTAFQCEEDILIREDDLAETGILGKWEISNESVNGISDLSVKCCRFIEFSEDENTTDLEGSFTYKDELEMVFEGTFQLDPSVQQIMIKRKDRETLVYNYAINSSKDYLTFTYSDEDSEIEEGWIKRDEP